MWGVDGPDKSLSKLGGQADSTTVPDNSLTKDSLLPECPYR